MTDRIAELLHSLDPATVQRNDPLSARAQAELAKYSALEAQLSVGVMSVAPLHDPADPDNAEGVATAVPLVPRRRRPVQFVSLAAAAALLAVASVAVTSMWPDIRSTATPPPEVQTALPTEPTDGRDVDGDGRPIEYTPIDTRAPEMNSLTVETIREFEPDAGVIWHVLDVSPEGEVLFSIPNDGDFDYDHGARDEAGQIGVLTESGVETFGSTEGLLSDLQPRSAVNGVITENYYVWLESTGVNYHGFNWRLFSQPRSGGPARLLAQSEDVCAPDNECSWATTLHMAADGDQVAWESPVRVSDTRVQNAVLSISAAGGELIIEQVPAIEPVAVPGGWLTLPTNDLSDNNALGSVEPSEYWLGIDRVTSPGAAEPIVRFGDPTTPPNWWVANLKSDGSLVAWQSRTSLNVTSLDGGSAYSLNVGTLTNYVGENIQICGGRVLWTTGPEEGPYRMLALDPATEEILSVEVPDRANGIFSCAGDYVVWKGSETSDEAVVVSRWVDASPDSSGDAEHTESELPDTPLVADLRAALTELEATPLDT